MKWLYALIAVTIVVVLLALTLQSGRMNTPARQQPPRYDHMLACAECQAAGQPARIWRTAAMQQVQCQAVWGDPVAVISRRGDKVEIDAKDWCRGWVSANLVQEQ
jgi:hypothetical protein